jgi:hypothetical protein
MTTPKDLQVTIGGVTLRAGESLTILPDGPGMPDLNALKPVELADRDPLVPDLTGIERCVHQADGICPNCKALRFGVGVPERRYLPSRTHDIDCHVIDIEADEDWGKDLPTMRIDPIEDDEYFELEGVRGHDCPIIAVGSKDLIMKWRAEATWHWVRSDRSGGWIGEMV